MTKLLPATVAPSQVALVGLHEWTEDAERFLSGRLTALSRCRCLARRRFPPRPERPGRRPPRR